MPMQISISERLMLCNRIADVEAPFIFLPAIEKGSTTPTRNVKEGWIISVTTTRPMVHGFD